MNFWILLITCVQLKAATSNSDSTGNVTLEGEDDLDCALDAAPLCLQSISELFNCTLGSWVSMSSCNDLLLTPEKMDSLCRLADEALNVCFIDILGNSCTMTDPKHSYYSEWQKPINALLGKLCTENSMITITESFGCEDESIFSCLFSFHRIDWIELVTTQMSAEVCSQIESRGQYCLSTSPFPLQCKSLIKLVKDLTQEFVDNTACSSQPVILVPLDTKYTQQISSVPQATANNGNKGSDESDKLCELDPIVVSTCFEPMVNEWKCYFSGSTTGCNFSLDSLCLLSLDAVEACAFDLIGYGCDLDSKHHFFHQWLSGFRAVRHELCGIPGRSDSLASTQQRYFSGSVSCWVDFFTCSNSLQNEKKWIQLIMEKITPSVCRELADNVDYCLMLLGISGKPCDPIFDKILAMKNAFINSPACENTNQLMTSGNAHHQKFSFILILATLNVACLKYFVL